MSDPVEARRVQARLAPPVAGPVSWLAEVGSTNDLAAERARAGAPEGTVIGADHQSAGRGRRGRVWADTPEASVAMSVVLRPGPEHSAAPLSLVVALGVAEGLQRLCDAPIRLIWPNDVVVEGRKLCGILCEVAWQASAVEWAVAGVGVNVRSAPTVQGAKWDPVSLAELGFEGSREDAAVAALTGLSRRYATWQRSGMASVLRAFRARDGLAGRRVVVRVDGEEREISGEAAGIDLQGRLLVAEGRAVRALPAAEVVQVLR